MKILPRVLTTATVAAATANAAAPPISLRDVRKHHSQAQIRCDIPPHDYIGAPTVGARAFTFTGDLIRATELPRDLNAKHSRVDYVLAATRVGVDQCSISGVALSVWDDGSWSLSFRADQNPQRARYVEGVLPGSSVPNRFPLILPGSSAPTLFTDHIKRNQFNVTVRGLASPSTSENADTSVVLARPVLFVINSGPFWVQRGVPLSPKFEGVDTHVRESFRRVDRVEVELTYR